MGRAVQRHSLISRLVGGQGEGGEKEREPMWVCTIMMFKVFVGVCAMMHMAYYRDCVLCSLCWAAMPTKHAASLFSCSAVKRKLASRFTDTLDVTVTGNDSLAKHICVKISWHFLLWELEGYTLPCCLLIGQYVHHMIFLPSSFYGEKCYGVHL